jgi:hypothetical protein
MSEGINIVNDISRINQDIAKIKNKVKKEIDQTKVGDNTA